MKSTLICTLGSQPQIVTFALDYLLRRRVLINEVIVLTLTLPQGQTERAVSRLQAEFAGDHYGGQACRLKIVYLRQNRRALAAVKNAADAERVRQIVYTLITDLKRSGRSLHLSIAGGPRMMALMTLSAAMIHCGHQDKVWHMYTEPDFLERARREGLLHDESGEQVQLVEVPLVPWGAYFAPLVNAATPREAVLAQSAWLAEADKRRCEQVIAQLTDRQEAVLQAFAKGQLPQDVAEQLCLSVKTVDTHKTRILAECKIAWGLPESRRLTFNFLHDKFGPFFNPYFTPE